MSGPTIAPELTSDPAAFLAAPVGRCLLGEHILVWMRDPSFIVTVIWGTPGDADLECMLAMTRARCRPSAVRHRALFDMRRLARIEHLHFEEVLRCDARYRARLSELITCQVVLRPAGLIGAAIEGYFKLLSQPARPSDANKICTDMKEALAWLALSPDDPLERELILLEEQARRTPRLMEALRRQLRAHPQSASLCGAAQALGVSTRTLQRQLREAGSSFRNELQAARVACAQELLCTTDHKLMAIAYAIGIKTPHYLGALFRRLTGESPIDFRRRHRAPSPQPNP